MVGLVITAEAHSAYAGACQQTNNTAELSGMTEALQFLMPLGPVPRDSYSVLLMYALFLSKREPMFGWLVLASIFSHKYSYCKHCSLQNGTVPACAF